MPSARLSSLLLKARPGPDESCRGEPMTQHPAGKCPALLGVQGARGCQGGSSTSSGQAGIMGTREHPKVPCPGVPSACRHKAVAPRREVGSGLGSTAAHGADWGEMQRLCGSLAANEFPGKEANNTRGMNFPSARVAGPSFTGKRPRSPSRTSVHTGRARVARASAHLPASPQGLVVWEKLGTGEEHGERSSSSCLPQFPCHTCPSPIPTLLIQDFRLHMAFLRFTASHSRRWPAEHKNSDCHQPPWSGGPLQPHGSHVTLGSPKDAVQPAGSTGGGFGGMYAPGRPMPIFSRSSFLTYSKWERRVTLSSSRMRRKYCCSCSSVSSSSSQSVPSSACMLQLSLCRRHRAGLGGTLPHSHLPCPPWGSHPEGLRAKGGAAWVGCERC